MLQKLIATWREDRVFVRRLSFLCALALLGLVLFQLRSVILDPLVDWLEERGMRRVLAIALLLVVLAGLLMVFLGFVLPLIIEQVRELMQILPRKIHAAYAWSEGWVQQQLGYQLPKTLSEAIKQVTTGVSQNKASMISPLAKWLGQSVGNAMSFVLGVLNLLIIPILAVFLLADFDDIVARIKHTVPEDVHASFGRVVAKVHSIFGQFLRGQLSVGGDALGNCDWLHQWLWSAGALCGAGNRCEHRPVADAHRFPWLVAYCTVFIGLCVCAKSRGLGVDA